MKQLGICKECFEPIYKKDEMLPDYPGMYQCSHCGCPEKIEEE